MSDQKKNSKVESKQITISLGNFILICSLFVMFIVGTIFCGYFYNKGYNDCYEEHLEYMYEFDDADYDI